MLKYLMLEKAAKVARCIKLEKGTLNIFYLDNNSNNFKNVYKGKYIFIMELRLDFILCPSKINWVVPKEVSDNFTDEELIIINRKIRKKSKKYIIIYLALLLFFLFLSYAISLDWNLMNIMVTNYTEFFKVFIICMVLFWITIYIVERFYKNLIFRMLYNNVVY